MHEKAQGKLEFLYFNGLLWVLIKAFHEKNRKHYKRTTDLRHILKESKSCQRRGETFTKLSKLNRYILLCDSQEHLVKEA